MTLRRIFPLAILAGLVIAALASDIDQYLTLDALRDNRSTLVALVAKHWLLAAAGFLVAYAGIVALSLPGATVMTLAGGFLFGVPIGATLSVAGATVGATALFLIARFALADFMRQRAGPLLARMAEGFGRNAFNYLLFLRLVPVFPFWAANLAPALLGMRLCPFVLATGVGIIPGTIVFSAFGASLGMIFDAGGNVQLADVLSPTLIAALIGLGLLALLPVVLKGQGRQQN